MSWKKTLTISTLLAGATAVGIHLLNKAIHVSATIEHMLNPVSETYYNWKFGKIYYEKVGSGKPILLIHDLNTCSSSYEWEIIAEYLSKKRTVYTLDLLGCGRSEKPNLTYTNYFYVQMIHDFIKNVIKSKCDIAVTGQSCSFVLGACQNDKDIIDNVVMINPADIDTMLKIPGKRSKTVTKLLLLPLIGTLLYNILVRKENIEKIFKESYFFDKSKIRHDQIQTYYETAHCGNASSKYLFASLSGKYLTANMHLYLKGLSNSIFIITGDEEKEKYIAENYKKILPSIEIFSIPNTKQLPQLEAPKKLYQQILLSLNMEE